jgi:hypothetical protein
MLLHFYNSRGLWQNPHHEFLVAAWSGDDSEESMVVHCAALFQRLRDLLGEVTSNGYKIEGIHMGDGKQKRVEVGNVSAAAGSSCEACTNLSSHMGEFTVLMQMDMDVRSNWEVMTRLVPKTPGATAAHQSKLDGGVKHLNISGVPPSAYYAQTLHLDLRATAVVWKKTYECLLAEGVETAVKQICALRGIKLKLGERTFPVPVRAHRILVSQHPRRHSPPRRCDVTRLRKPNVRGLSGFAPNRCT